MERCEERERERVEGGARRTEANGRYRNENCHGQTFGQL